MILNNINWTVEWITIAASLFELLGLILLGNKKRIGFISNIVGDVLWILYTVITGNAIGLLFICTIAIILNNRGYIKWAMKNNKKCPKCKKGKIMLGFPHDTCDNCGYIKRKK